MQKDQQVSYYVEIEQFARPVGRLRFGATPRISKNVDASVFTVPPPLQEVWGETRSEAIAKAREAMEAWASKERVPVTYVA